MTRSLKINSGNSKVMILGGEEGLVRNILIDGTGVEHVFWMNQIQIMPKVVGR